MMPPTLRMLLRRLPPSWGTRHGAEAPRRVYVTAIAEDSRRVTSGAVFVAHKGRGVDGHRYIAAALRAGAVAIVGENPYDEVADLRDSPIPYWRVEDARLAFSLLSAAYYNFPTRRMIVVGVTGTDGKTTTCTLIQSILAKHGLRTGLITTIAARVGDEELDTGFHTTTPEAFDLQGYLARMEQAGCAAVVLETTSHALDQERVAHVEYDVAAVTNVTHEHLDWHGTWDNYMQAKARLFRALHTSRHKSNIHKTAVLNLEDKSYPILREIPAERVMTYSVNGLKDGAVSAKNINASHDGVRFLLRTPIGEVVTQLALVGEYNVANALAAACVGLSVGVSLDDIVKGLQAVTGVKGRMEYAYRGRFDVLIDFAHTPNALKMAIATARTLTSESGRVIVLFGSAGLRDVQKRRLMGEVACAADIAVVTAEDPRTEDVNAIIDEIVTGLRAGGRREGDDFFRVPDRAEAIDTAIGLARSGDVIVCCGKAHERSMAYGTVETPWDEFAAVRSSLERHHLTPANGTVPRKGRTRSTH